MTEPTAFEALQTDIKFANFPVSGQIFYRPIVPGHVLLIPERVVKRLADLRPDELSDLFSSAQRVGSVLERHYKATALTVAVQDGPAAGQSVPHVHVHVMPRSMGDHEPPDRVYDELDRFDGAPARPAKLKIDADEDRKPRSAEEMRREAGELAALFQ